MAYCDTGCEYLTSRHNCEKYKKRLAYSQCTFGGVSSGAIHEMCSECEKDHIILQQDKEIAELKKKLKDATGEDL